MKVNTHSQTSTSKNIGMHLILSITILLFSSTVAENFIKVKKISIRTNSATIKKPHLIIRPPHLLPTKKIAPLSALKDSYIATNPLTIDTEKTRQSASHKAIIGGIAKNIEVDYDKFMRNMENLRSQFQDSTVVIVTDGSQDKTEELLENYAKLHSNTHIFKIHNQGTHRTDKMAYARNVFMDESAQFFDTHDYLISFDFDVHEVQAETINNALAHEDQWDVVTVNPLKIYYDKWALRTDADNRSCWGNDKNPGYRCAESMGHWFPGANVGDGIPVDHAPLKVQSAFGGLGLYKTKTLAECRSKPGGCKYSGEDSDGFGDCEHVVFHKNLREKAGARIFIWPSMTLLHVNHKDTQL